MTKAAPGLLEMRGEFFMTETKTLDRRSQYSVDAIQNALFTLLEEKDLSAVTVTDICRLADAGMLRTMLLH